MRHSAYRGLQLERLEDRQRPVCSPQDGSSAAKPIMGISTRHDPKMGFAALNPSYGIRAINAGRAHGM
jgi:hypothetical protein